MGVPGVAAGKVVIIGGGVVGMNAATVAVGMGADVTILDKSLPRLAELDRQFGGRAHTIYATAPAIEGGSAGSRSGHWRGFGAGRRRAETVSRSLVSRMKKGAVIVDVAIDQGGSWKPHMPQRMPTRFILWTAWCITASPICPEPWRGLRHSA